MIERHYSLHNSLNITLKDKRDYLSRQVSLFEKDYDYFSTSKTFDTPDLVIELGKFTPQIDCNLVENDIYKVKDDYLFGSFKYKIAKYQFELSNFNKSDKEKPILLRIQPNFFGNRVIHEQVIDYIVYFMLNQRGICSLHASGVCKNDHSILFTGPGGAGKTSFSLSCLKEGFKFLGDDRILIHNGYTFEFPECPGFKQGNIQYISDIISRKNRMGLSLNRFLETVTLGYIGGFVYLKSRDVFPQYIGRKSRLKTIICIQPSYKYEITPIDTEKVIDHFYTNQLFENRRFLRHVYNYSTIYPSNELEKDLDRYAQNLQANIPKDIEAYEIRLRPEDYQRVHKWLKETILDTL
ncbi:phosphoenolpyruvate carboxykinase (ATP) [Methanofollis ethanolicus]|uniref:hypothetical protein n=1 Tax=Methanofollis ethanolicus TaxID=488124 RepID=UPI00128F0573|nr:hypothetical protein [Methanofollis ethanolicus]